MPSRLETWKPPRMHVARTREQAHYTTADWFSKRRRILVRDAFTCQSCSRIVHGKAAHVDHIVPLEEGGTDEDGNLQTLCDACHGVKTRGEQRRRGLIGGH